MDIAYYGERQKKVVIASDRRERAAISLFSGHYGVASVVSHLRYDVTMQSPSRKITFKNMFLLKSWQQA